MATDATTNPTETINAGGFLIEIEPNELTVSKGGKFAAATTFKKPLWKKLVGGLFLAALGTYLIVTLIRITISLIDRPSIVFPILLLLIVPSLLWSYFKGDNNLHCTPDLLDVVNLARGRQTISSFPKAEIRRIRFGEVGTSKYGAICGLLFDARGKKVKLLSGLESPEAQTILRQLDRMGYNVEHDVGMPMAVEMALERRNSIWG